MKIHRVVLIPGDGIGPEVTQAVQRILEVAGAPLEWEERQAGITALESSGEVLPAETVEAIQRHHLALKGPCTTPISEGFTSASRHSNHQEKSFPQKRSKRFNVTTWRSRGRARLPSVKASHRSMYSCDKS